MADSTNTTAASPEVKHEPAVDVTPAPVSGSSSSTEAQSSASSSAASSNAASEYNESVLVDRLKEVQDLFLKSDVRIGQLAPEAQNEGAKLLGVVIDILKASPGYKAA